MNLPPDKVLLKWMNFQLKKAGYQKEVTNFSTDLKVSSSMTLKLITSFMQAKSKIFVDFVLSIFKGKAFIIKGTLLVLITEETIASFKLT